ncbi:hypothetical protein ACOSP7_004240 [Xanthoceras sorbifolium]
MATEKTQDQINNAAQISCVQRDYNQLTVADQGTRYRECRRNHAASLGKHATDGCGEFLKAGDDGTEKGFLCAACRCHRSFHRKELLTNQLHVLPPPPPLVLARPVVLYHSQVGSRSSKRAFGEEKIKEMEMERKMMKAKKRAKLSAEQKNKMKTFADKLGWRPQKHDEEEIEKFCNEVGISQKIFKGCLNNNRRRLEPERCSVANRPESMVLEELNVKDI